MIALPKLKDILYPHALAVDLGVSAVKVLDLSKKVNGNYVVENYGISYIPEGIIVDNSIRDPDYLSSTLKKLLKSMKCKTKNAIIGMPNNQSVTKIIQVTDGYTDDEILDEIILEADRYIPYPVQEAYFDYQIMGKSDKSKTMLDIQLAASKVEAVQERVDVLTQAGLKTTIVDLNRYALERIFLSQVKNFIPDQGENRIIAFIDLGYVYSSIIVFDQLEPVYARETSFGGSQLISEIQQRYSLDFLETFYMLHHGTLPMEFDQDILEPFKETITQQVSRLLQLFSSSDDVYKDGVEMIVLTGGLSSVPDLDKVVTNFLGIKTLIGDPFLTMELNENLDSEDFLLNTGALNVCCGLALRNFT